MARVIAGCIMFVGGLCMVFAGTGCKSIPGEKPKAFRRAPRLKWVDMKSFVEPELPPPDPVFHNPPVGVVQRLQPGDLYHFRIVGTDIEARLRVSLSGTVDLPSPLGALKFVQGFSPDEFREYLKEHYAPAVRNIEVFLAREEYQPRVAYVVGHSRPQRVVELNDKSALLSVLATVLWMPGIHGESVIVFRKGRTRRVWLPHIYCYGHGEENLRILPDDVIAIIPVKGITACGMVRNPGKFFPGGDMPLPNFLLSIGGARPQARLDSVHVFRRDGSEEIADLSGDAADASEVGDGDVVFVPAQRKIKVYIAGAFGTTGYEGYWPHIDGVRLYPEGIRLSQLLALGPLMRFGAALNKTTVIPGDGSEAIKVNVNALLNGSKDEPDPYLDSGAVVYVPQTRTAHALLFMQRVAGLFINPPVAEIETKYMGNLPNEGRKLPVGPQPQTSRDSLKSR